MTVLKICDTGLTADTARAFHSMLNIVAGRSVARWQASSFDQADVLLAHADSDPVALSHWNASGKPLVLVVDDRESWPPSQYVLRHPFRVMQLLSLLDDVAVSLQRRPSADTMASGTLGWAVAESLRRIVGNAGDRSWHMARGDGAAVWIHDGQAHATPTVVAALRAGKLRLRPFEATSERPTADSVAFATSDVAWCVGLQATTGVAPWLNADCAYRLRRWPDFGRLEAQPELIELSAALASRAMTPQQLAQRSGHPIELVNRFMAAVSLAGLLGSGTAGVATSAASASPPVKGSWTRFVADLCRHLRRVA